MIFKNEFPAKIAKMCGRAMWVRQNIRTFAKNNKPV
jgi:hypothetical protein